MLLPGEEDFGIAPVEAQACGTPVIALARGGALETVIDGVTGVLVDEPTPTRLPPASRARSSMPFDRAVIRAHAVTFDRAVFSRAIQSTIESLAACLGDTAACLVARLRRLGRDARHRGIRPGVSAALLERPHPGHARLSAVRAVRRGHAVRRRARPARLLLSGGLPPAARPVARRRLLPRLHRHRRRGDPRHRHHAVRRRVPRVAGRAGRRRVSGLAHRLGAVPGHQHRAHVRLARARARTARAALESRHSG